MSSQKPTEIKFEKSSRKNKKYKVTFKWKREYKTVHFGDDRYEQFKDSTPIKLYKKLNHGDKDRRRRYLARAKGIKNKAGKLTYKDPTSANYWSVKYLW